MAETTGALPFWNWLVYAVARLVLRLIGWRAAGPLPALPKYVAIATHTSNWDFGLALLGMAVLSRGFHDQHMAWMGKQELFRGPMGPIMRAVGGIAINRSAPQGAVEQVIDLVRRSDRLVLIVTPQGSRSRREYWKTGFYRVATGAGVPILLGFADYRRKVVGVGPLITPSGDIEADLVPIREFYSQVTAKFPDQAGEIAIK